LRIILFGIPEFGIICLKTLLKANKNVVALVLPPRSHPTRDMMKQFVESLGIPAISVDKKMKDPRLVEEIRSYNPDLIIISSYPRLLPKEIYEIPPLGTINCHPSMLPNYRGPNPYFHVINDGLSQTGISFHYVDDSFDTGDLIFQTPFPLEPDETLGSLFIKISITSSELYLMLINKLETGQPLPAKPQPVDTTGLIYAEEVKHDSPILLINWAKSARQVDNLVRASNPFFGAFSFYRNLQLKIFSGSVEEKPWGVKPLPPGTIAKVTSDKLAISTGEGYFYPEVIQFGLLYLTNIKDFIKRNKPKTGEVLN
jgi:methionyl-tRNA formyltransferase